MNYYNEFDPKAAAWLRELIKAGEIPSGHVDERSIKEIKPNDLDGYTQCHFFAGIGGWSYALRLAGWPENRPVWTGSCPCQPFSDAGLGKGINDERHLWPNLFTLIKQRQPSVVFGEQVASKAGLGWLDGVCADLEGADYAVGAADLCAAGAGSPHIRQRLYWVADAKLPQRGAVGKWNERHGGYAGRDEATGGVGACGEVRGLADANGEGFPGQSFGLLGAGNQGYWSSFDLLHCLDGKARRIEPGSFPLAHGVPGRVGLLRGYGNAIVPQVAATFIESYLDTLT